MGAFNRTPYNRLAEESSYAVQYSFYTDMVGVAGPPIRHEAEGSMSSDMTAQATLGNVFSQDWDFSQDMTGKARLDGLITPSYPMSAAMTASALAYLVTSPKYEMYAEMKGRANATIAIYPSPEMYVEMTGEMLMYICIFPSYTEWIQFMDGIVAVEHLIPERTFIDLQLAPGEVVTINSELFTVYRDNDNALAEYEGEFVILNRDAHSIEVSGGLDVRVLYTEAYL